MLGEFFSPCTAERGVRGGGEDGRGLRRGRGRRPLEGAAGPGRCGREPRRVRLRFPDGAAAVPDGAGTEAVEGTAASLGGCGVRLTDGEKRRCVSEGRVWLRRRPDPGGSENGAARRRRLLPSRVAEVVAADDSVGEAPGLPQVLFRRAVNGRPTRSRRGSTAARGASARSRLRPSPCQW